MGRTTKVLSFSLPPKIAQKIEYFAKKEHRSKSEVLREMVDVYEARQADAEWEKLFAFGERTAERFNLKNEDELFKFLNQAE